jgi:hypothetical protein
MNLTPPYPNALDIVNCKIHGILAFRKAEKWGNLKENSVSIRDTCIQPHTFAHNLTLESLT